MRILPIAVLALACVACDRRDDPDVDRSSTGVTSSPGERVLQTPESAGDTDTAAARPSMPPASLPPDADCPDGADASSPECRSNVPTQDTQLAPPGAPPPQ